MIKEKPEEVKSAGGDFGETEIIFGDDKVRVTERKSGETTHNPEREPKSFFSELNPNEKEKALTEIEKFKSGRGFIGLSPSEINFEISRKREEIAKKILEERKGQ